MSHLACIEDATKAQIDLARSAGMPDQAWAPCKAALAQLAMQAGADLASSPRPRTCQELGMDCQIAKTQHVAA